MTSGARIHRLSTPCPIDRNGPSASMVRRAVNTRCDHNTVRNLMSDTAHTISPRTPPVQYARAVNQCVCVCISIIVLQRVITILHFNFTVPAPAPSSACRPIHSPDSPKLNSPVSLVPYSGPFLFLVHVPRVLSVFVLTCRLRDIGSWHDSRL
jgi:hypothetical protein